MFKKLTAVLFLLLITYGTAWGYDYNPFNMSRGYLNSSDQIAVYSRWGNNESGFFYQLRDVTGASRQEQVAGPQWFATVYENYYNAFRTDNDTTTYSRVYRRTMGGEIPDVTFSAVGDLLDNFSFVFAEEPQPYAAWRNLVDTRVYDIYPDPIESLCVVITNGTGDFNVKFGNPYARHFPFWWNWYGNIIQSGWYWWRNNYDWRDSVNYPTVEPVAYIYSPQDNGIYKRGENYNYTKLYEYGVLSEDASGDVLGYGVKDLSGNAVLTLSGDNTYYDSADNLAYTVEDNCVYDASGNLVYTLEQALGYDGSLRDSDTYICEVREVNELVSFADFGDTSVIALPATEQPIRSGNYLETIVRIRGDAYTYGSRLGYITFRQRASFTAGYTNYREFSSIPMVIANVANGNASANPLLFDMIITDQSGDVVNRIKFTWDAQSDRTQDIGTFFMMTPYNATTPTPYHLETRITNRTGTRYELYRYDRIRGGDGDSGYRNDYREIFPDYWRYDIIPDNYGTLPDSFLLDAHSQIAPGLVTVYSQNIGDGYSTIDMQNDTSASFRLYEYASAIPRNLTLNYRRVAGMTTAGAPQELSGDRGSIQGFSMQFVDIRNDNDNTADELRSIMGKSPVMVDMSQLDDDPVRPQPTYIRNSALNSFRISYDVPEELQERAVYSEDVTPDENTNTSQDQQPQDQQGTDNQDGEAPVAAAEQGVKYISERAALQPIYVRLRLSARDNQLLASHWQALEGAADSRALFNEFASFGTVWVRSDAASERDTNLFTAINRKGGTLGVNAADCVRAFIDDNVLCLEFIVIMADAVSTQEGYSAFIDVFKDDGIPYILIGDGAVDKSWRLQFYVDAQDANPSSGTDIVLIPPAETVSSNESSGGGCNFGWAGMLGVVVLALALKRK